MESARESRRRERPRLLGEAMLANETAVVRTPLAAGCAGQRLRWHGYEEIQVSDLVPARRVAAVARHMMAHGSFALVDALGAVTCDGQCALAAGWLAQPSSQAISG